MGLFSDIVVIEEAKLEEERVGGSGNYIDEAGVYTLLIKKAYGLNSTKSDSKGIKLELETEDGKTISWSTWFLNAEGKPYYIDKKTNEKKQLMGINQIYSLNMLLNGKIGFPDTEKRIMEIEFQDEPKEVDTVTSWMGKPILGCIKMIKEDKYKEPTESREFAEIQHFADPVDERFADEKPEAEPKKLDKFKEAINAGKTHIDRRKKSKGGATSSSGSTTEDNKPKRTF